MNDWGVGTADLPSRIVYVQYKLINELAAGPARRMGCRLSLPAHYPASVVIINWSSRIKTARINN